MHETYFPKSTAIRSAAYDDETRELTIGLTSGRTYVYREVQDWIYDELLAAKSVGQYYNLRIKDRFPYDEILVHERRPVRPRRSETRLSLRRVDPSRGSRAPRALGPRGR
jgi:hypothetical protein